MFLPKCNLYPFIDIYRRFQLLLLITGGYQEKCEKSSIFGWAFSILWLEWVVSSYSRKCLMKIHHHLLCLGILGIVGSWGPNRNSRSSFRSWQVPCKGLRGMNQPWLLYLCYLVRWKMLSIWLLPKAHPAKSCWLRTFLLHAWDDDHRLRIYNWFLGWRIETINHICAQSKKHLSWYIFVNIVSIFEAGNPSVLKVKTQSFHQKFLEDERRRRRLLEDEVGRRRRGPPLEMEEVGENQRKNVEGRWWKMFKKVR